MVINEFDQYDRTELSDSRGATFKNTHFPPLHIHLDEVKALEAFVCGEVVDGGDRHFFVVNRTAPPKLAHMRKAESKGALRLKGRIQGQTVGLVA